MRTVCLLLVSVLLMASTAYAADGDFYTESAAQGEFAGATQVSSDPYNAGEIRVEAQGVLPPTEEKVVITSNGTLGDTYGVGNCKKIEWDDREGDNDGYCILNHGPDGTYLYDVNYTLKTEAEMIDNLDTCTRGGNSITATPYIDDGPPGRGRYNDPYEDDHRFFDSYDDVDKPPPGRPRSETDPNERTPSESKSSSADVSQVREPDVVEDEYGNNYCNTDGSKPRRKTFTETFTQSGSASVGTQPQCSSTSDCVAYSSDDGDFEEFFSSATEEFYMFFRPNTYTAGPIEIVPSYEMNSGEMTYVTPVGNTYLDIGGDTFTPKTYAQGSTVSRTLSPDAEGWMDTSKTIDVELPSLNGYPAGGTKKVLVEGEYWASSPPGVEPEGYRWVHSSNPSKVLASHTSLDSSQNGYRKLSTEFDQTSKTLPSGEYRLQIKSTADNYPVEVKQRDFEVRRDAYIDYRESRSFNPELELGDNPISFYTRGSNDLQYNVEWTECQQPARDIQPGDNVDLETVSPVLSVTTNCNSINSVEFRNAKTETTVKTYTDVQKGTELEAQSDVSLGETYEWYIRFCDQGKCYDTETYEFAVGGISRGDGSSPSEVDASGATEGLDREIRDEDFNAFGQDTRTSTPLSQGYINKIEDDSDQLETGVKWKNSDGSRENADQYAITPSPEWTIDNRGNMYPPPTDPQYRSTYYRTTSNRRSTISDSSVLKSSKVFGNSLGVVAAEDITGSGDGLVARKGTGVWIDPDQIRKTRDNGEYDYAGDWKQLLSFNIDITGPDSGLGYDDNEGGSIDYRDNRKVAITDIHWQRQS